MCATPSAQLIQHEWAKHGTCTGLNPADYFGKSGGLYARLRYPDMNALSRGPLTVGQFTAAFAAANPGKALPLVDAQKAGAVMAYGNFITIAINFVILAICIFIVVKLFNTARKKFEKAKPAAAPAGPTTDQRLLTEIRDLLAKR